MFKELTDNSPYGRTLRHWDRTTGSWQEEHTFIESLNGVTGSSSWSIASAAPPISELYGVYGRLATPCAKRRAFIWCATSSALLYLPRHDRHLHHPAQGG